MSSNNLKLGKLIAMVSLLAMVSCSSVKPVQVSPASQKVLITILKAKDDAVKVGATMEMGDFRDAIDDLNDVVADVEDGEINESKEDQAEVEAEFRAVELRLIKEKNLTAVKTKLKTLRDGDGDELAPKSVGVAKASIDEAEKTIEADRYNTALIEEKVKEASFLVDRAVSISAQAQGLSDQSSEDILLKEEAVLEKIRTASSGVILDSRDKSIVDQGTDVAMFVKTSIKVGKTISKDKKTLEGEVANKDTEIKKKEDELQKLTKQEETVNKIRAIFSAGEADVFVQDGKVVVRLVGLGFKIGSSLVEESNKDILSKMQTLVESVQATSLVVEGHTDSMGPAVINDKLAIDRAESIKAYLVSNQILTEEAVKAEGFGANRPIATNDNWQGRRKNRRIDIVMDI